MKQTGIVREIAGENLMVEPFRGDPGEGSSCCGPGGCESCGQRGRTRLIKVGNPGNIDVKAGSLVSFEVPSALAVFAAFRVLFLPPALFAAFYVPIGGTAGIVAGAVAAVATLILNFLFKNRASELEKPKLAGVLSA